MKRTLLILLPLLMLTLAGGYLPHRRGAFQPVTGGSSEVAFPLVQTDGLYMRYAADTLGLANGTPVIQWTNCVGAFGLLRSNAAAAYPFWTNNAGLANGKPWVQFDIEGGALTNQSHGFSVPYSMFLVISTPNTAASDMPFCNIGGADPYHQLHTSTDNYYIVFPDLDSGEASYLRSATLIEIKIRENYTGGSNCLKTNGILSKAINTDYASLGFNKMQLNYRRFGSGQWKLWEFCIITNTISDSQEASINAYFKSKYNLPLP